MELLELRNKSAQLSSEIKKQAAEAEARKAKGEPIFNESSKNAWDQVNAEYDSVRSQIADAESAESLVSRVRQVEEDQNRSTRHGRQMPGLDDTLPGESRTYGDAGFDRDEARHFAQREADKRNALAAFLLACDGDDSLVDARMQESCERIGFNFRNKSKIGFRALDTESHKQLQRQARKTANIRDIDVRGLTKGGSTSGAELVPQTFAATFELAMLATSPMLAYVDTITTTDGNNFLWPVGNDTAVEGAIAAEVADINAVTQTDPNLVRLTLGAYAYHSRFLKVSEQLLRDSIVNVDQIVATMLGERLGRILLRHITVGTGTGQPFGVVVDAVAGRTSASATAISTVDLIELQHSVDPAYRPNGTFMANDNVIKTLRLLNDSQGRPLWASGLRDAVPDTILGQPIIYNQYMASAVATTNITMVYGDLSYYKLRRVGAMSMRRLVERFAETREVAFIGYMDADGRLQKPGGGNAAAVCPVKRLTQA
jgi:HK97 family phage major capsid protein